MNRAKLAFCAGVASLSLSACANQLPRERASLIEPSAGDPLAGSGVRAAPAPSTGDVRMIGDFGRKAGRQG